MVALTALALGVNRAIYAELEEPHPDPYEGGAGAAREMGRGRLTWQRQPDVTAKRLPAGFYFCLIILAFKALDKLGN
jgi:hypothetical protein